MKSPSVMRRWIVNPLNVDTALHIHEAVQFALARVFNAWVEPKLLSSETEIRCVPTVLDRTHKISDLLCCHSYQMGLHPAMHADHSFLSNHSLCTRSPILD